MPFPEGMNSAKKMHSEKFLTVSAINCSHV